MDANTFQQRIDEWMHETFVDTIRTNKVERAMRFLEESLELCQSLGLTSEQAGKIQDYVYSRPIGETHQEVGGVMVTLAALCGTAGLNMANCGELELARINRPEIKAKIQAKQVTKQIMGITPTEL